ncbi:hypothetical protein V9T20_12820 (plasmid) [Halobacterium salinarum]|uniref:hypothetical protein n=1 Tax=Halobacterium salinarum TaxID=2242 RepID=UPI0030D1F13B
MAKIKLINENGVIKGIDPETGEEVPVEFEDLETQSVSAGELSSDNAIHPDFTQRVGTQAQPQEAKWYPDNGAPRFTEFKDLSGTLPNGEGLAVRNGDIYVGEQGQSGGATIYCIDGGDASVVDTYTFADTEATHTNSLAWQDGYLWVGDASTDTDTTYIVDYGKKAVVDSFPHDGSLNEYVWRAFVPDYNGKPYLVFTNFAADGAYLVDPDAARSNNSGDAGIVRELSQGFERRIQAGEWVNGYLYWASHDSVCKVRAPFADGMREGYPVSSGGGIEWILPHVTNTNTSWGPLEQVGFDPDSGRLFLLTDNRVLVGEEGVGNALPEGFNVSDIEIVNEGYRTGRAFRLIGGSAQEDYVQPRFEIADSDIPMRATAWMYDDLGSTKFSVFATNPGTSTTSLGVNTTDVGSTNYARFTSANLWEDTGVARPATPRWVGFSMFRDGDNAELRISTDGGMTWQDAGSAGEGDPAIDFRLLQREGESLWSDFTFEFINQ